MPHRRLAFRPARIQVIEELPADLSVQPAHAVDVAAAAHRQIRHVERLVGIPRIAPAHRQELRHLQAGGLDERLRIFHHQRRLELVERRGDGRVRGEDIARARGPERDVKRLMGALRETQCAGQHRERRVAFVEMADLHVDAQFLHQPPAAHAEHDLLQQSFVFAGGVEVGGDAAVPGVVQGVVAVEQIQHDLADARLPDAQQERAPGQFQPHARPAPILAAHRRNRQAPRIVVRKRLELAAIAIQHLPEIALLIEQPDADYRHAQVAGAFEVIAGQHPQAARVDGQRLAQPEFHAEICDGLQRCIRVRVLEPAGALLVLVALDEPILELFLQVFVFGGLLQALLVGVEQDHVGVLGALPGLGIEPVPDSPGQFAAGPAQIQRQIGQVLQFLRQWTMEEITEHIDAPGMV